MDTTEMKIDNEEGYTSSSSSSDDEDQTHSCSHPSHSNGRAQDLPTTSTTVIHSGASTPVDEPERPMVMTARAYQLEMLEESLKQNIIVAVCFWW